MAKFIFQSHCRLHDWVAEEKGYLTDEGFDYEPEVALGRNIPVIPVLVRKVSIPTEEELPLPLKSLAYRNGIQIRPDPDFSGDMDRLIKGIEPHLSR